MAIDTGELLARVCALEQEALLATLNIASTAVPRWLYQQEQFPYWRNRIANVQLDTSPDDYGQEMDVYIYTLSASLMLAPYMAGYNGENDERLLSLIPQVIEYFDARELLQSEGVYSEPMNFLRTAGFVSNSGYETFPVGTAGEVVIGTTFQFRAVLSKFVQQFY